MTFHLAAMARTALGRQAKKVRAEGMLPGVVYGQGVEPKAVAMKLGEFQKIYRDAGSSSLIDLAIDGAPLKVLIQEVQVNPLTMKPQHVDLRCIRMDQEVTVDVPLVFINEAPAVKELAGTLVRAYETLQVTCLPADLPHQLEVDLSGLKTFDDVVTVADLKLPKGVQVLEETTVSIASVTPPLSEEQLKKMEEEGNADVSVVKTEAEEKKAEEVKKAEEEAAAQQASS